MKGISIATCQNFFDHKRTVRTDRLEEHQSTGKYYNPRAKKFKPKGAWEEHLRRRDTNTFLTLNSYRICFNHRLQNTKKKKVFITFHKEELDWCLPSILFTRAESVSKSPTIHRVEAQVMHRGQIAHKEEEGFFVKTETKGKQ